MIGKQGVLLIDKPQGLTSHDVVVRVRRVLGERRVGHAGTLDPGATGLLVLCIGETVRLLEYIAADEKAYEGVVAFGAATDTDDAFGRVIARASAAGLAEEAVRHAASGLVGDIWQRVPAYAAVKIGGRRAYELARSGQAVDMPVRQVRIHSLEVTSFTPGEVAHASFRVVCSKGTYVRALCRDWGQAVGLPAHLAALRRTRVGWFRLEDAIALDAWEASPAPRSFLRPARDAVAHLPQVAAREAELTALAQGKPVSCPDAVAGLAPGEPVAVLAPSGEVAAIALVAWFRGARWLRPHKVLWRPAHAGMQAQTGKPGRKRGSDDAGD
ncbi:tRNA pseudouridine synthase B [Alicyclobacillus cellulosilyticus]|uniref:tRNA pseudouridine synthase B n=1 Tax=Alicyclobacillus cellulosilyticus TaxID=1003997 RepID=A0A917K8B3_9BACL|nr:tRNA pseudouridine(55) synthase TruB [Alicyclobacillus cellulosilyticus]GGJ04768.1 tRNA pseudouridine synthase B [Alicyclobacillus cellulosilyticus]